MDLNTKPVGFGMMAERLVRNVGAEMSEARGEKRSRHSPTLSFVQKGASKDL